MSQNNIQCVTERCRECKDCVVEGLDVGETDHLIEKALHHPLLDEIDFYSATNMGSRISPAVQTFSFRDVTGMLTNSPRSSWIPCGYYSWRHHRPAHGGPRTNLSWPWLNRHKPRWGKINRMMSLLNNICPREPRWLHTEKNKSDKAQSFRRTRLKQEDYPTYGRARNKFRCARFSAAAFISIKMNQRVKSWIPQQIKKVCQSVYARVPALQGVKPKVRRPRK